MSTRTTVIALKSGDKAPGKPEAGCAAATSQAADRDLLSRVFAITGGHDTSGFFQTVELKKRLEEVLAGLNENDGVYLIEGKAGGGKSAFLDWMMQQAPSGWTFCHITARKALGEKQLLEQLNRSLFPELELDIETLITRTKQRVRGGEHIAIVVDDADRLSPFALKTLFVIKTAVEKRGGRLGLVLAGSDVIQAALGMPSLAALSAKKVRRLVLSPFTYQQTQDYIYHCLEAAGAEKEISLTPRKLRRIYNISRGLPKAINRVIQEVLQDGDTVPTPVSVVGDRLSHYRVFILSVAAFGLVIGGGYTVYRSMVEQAPQVSATVSADHLRELMVLPVSPQASVAPTDGEGEKFAERKVENASSPVSPSLPSQVNKAPISAPVPVPSSKPAMQQQKPVKPPQSVTNKTPVRAPAGIRDSAWVLAQDSSHFTIQLTSWEDEARARRYIEKNGLQDKAAYVHTRSKGKDWYLVIYNAYPSLRQARQAVGQLPPALRKYGPWVRNISSLQTEAVVD